MPRAPRFLASVIASLHHDLRYAPAKTKQRQMDAAEALIDQVRFDLLYPMEFVVYRVTGFRPESGTFDASVVGRPLVRDLAVFVQALSAELELGIDQPRGRAISIDEVARKLGIHRRTLQRRRGDGLVLHWVRDTAGRRLLACFPDSLDRFLENAQGPMRHMRPWTRVPEEERKGMVEQGRILHAAGCVSLDAAASRIAAETGRARSTVRQVLKRHDRSSVQPVFNEHGPLSARDARFCIRAQGMGIALARCGRRFGKSVPAMHRAMLRERVSRLAGLPIHWVDVPTFDRVDADEVLLGVAEVQEGLLGPDGLIDLADLSMPSVATARERMVVAGHWLMSRAGKGLASLPAQPTAAQVDAIECDLKWAGRIRAAIVHQGLPSTLQACEHWLGRPVMALPRDAAMKLLSQCLGAAWQVVEALEPRLANRLESRCSAAMDRMLSNRRSSGRPRATARHEPGDLQLAWPMRDLVAWPWLEPAHDWVMRIGRLDPDDTSLVTGRWGLNGTRPRTIAELSRDRASTPTAIQRRLHAIEVRLRMDRP